MKVATRVNWTVGQLCDKLKSADPKEVIEFTRERSQKGGKCWCGCLADVKNKFVPGHDAQFHAFGKRVGRGEAEMPSTWASELAEEDFLKWVEVGRNQAKRILKQVSAEQVVDEP